MELIHYFKSPDCCLCSTSFTINGYGSPHSMITPYVLSCGHSACSKCLKAELSSKSTVTCKICKTVTTAPCQYDLNYLSRAFPINYFFMGIWSDKHSKFNPDTLDAKVHYSKPVIKKKKNAVTCNECLESKADSYCKQCNSPYCSACFKIVHMSARAFRSHVKVPLIENLINLEPIMCKIHSEKKLEFFCTICRISICSRCMVEEHNGHTVNMLTNSEEDYQEEFIERYIKVTNVLNRLKASKKKVEHTIRDNKDIAVIREINNTIFEWFIQLHGKLLVLQNNMHMQLSLADTTIQLQGLLQILKDSVTNTEGLLTVTKYLMEDQSQQKSEIYSCIIESLKAKEELPCHLLEETSIAPPRFIVDEDLFAKLENLCTLEIPTGDKFRLVKESELPEEYEVTPLPVVSRDDVLKLLNNPSTGSIESSSPVPSEQNSECGTSPSEDKEPHSSSPNIYTDDLAVGCQIRGHISHLISPSDFYIQRETADRKLAEFRASLRNIKLRAPKKIEKGEIHLCLYEQDNKWYRARILDISSENVKVFYLDFGNTEYVPRARIKRIPKNSLNIPVLAYRCKLHNCVPRNGTEWDPKAVSFMAEVIENDYVTVIVVNKTPLTYIVDLYRVSTNLIINIQQALCFQEYASYVNYLEPLEPNITEIEPLPTKLQSQMVKEGDILEVHVCYVSSPHEFYVQNCYSSKRLIKMSEELQRAYNIRNKSKYSIYDPKKEMFVAARRSKDMKWYRGQIINILDQKVFQVYFVDFGHEEEISWENVKLLQSRFFSIPPQAMKCVLSDVLPLDDKDEWGEDVCSEFNKMVFNKKFKLVVESLTSNHLSVVLYKIQEDADICINALLVREKFAVSTGVNSTVVEYPKVYTKLPHQDLFQCEVGVEKTMNEKQIFEPPKLDKEIFLSSLVKAPNGTFRIHIFVKRIVSPGEFYVTPTCFKETLLLLEVGLQKFYERSREDDKEWNLEDKCVIKHDGKWYRAIILEILGDNKFKVALPDEGMEVIAEKKWIRPLHHKFMTVNDGVIRCHLGGLEPPLGKWPLRSTTEFQEYVKDHHDSLFMCQLGELKDALSLPVEIFRRDRIDAGPTEPFTDKWSSFNHYLRISGLAKSDNKVQWDCDGNILNWSDIEQSSHSGSEKSVFNQIFSSSLQQSSAKEEIHNYLENQEKVTSIVSEIQGDSAQNLTPFTYQDIIVPDAWLPPLPLEKLEFVASPTYVDHECNVYLHNFHESHHLLEEISTALCTKYDNTLPKPYDASIQPGDICIAQYHLDNKWYRAVLLDIKPEFDEYEIQFVDYGNVETCKISELRKIPVCHHIPIQAVKCCFHNLLPIDPSGIWNTRHIEIIQYNIVDKNCQIKLVKLPDSDIYGIKQLKLPDGRDYVAEIVREGFARYSNSPTTQKIAKTTEAGKIKNDGGKSESDATSRNKDEENHSLPESEIKENVQVEESEIMKNVSKANDKIEQCKTMKNDQLEESKVAENICKEKDQIEESKLMENKQVEECKITENDQVEECKIMENDQVEECKIMENDQVEECKITENYQVEECKIIENEQVEECKIIENDQVEESKIIENEQVDECKSMENDQVEESETTENDQVEKSDDVINIETVDSDQSECNFVIEKKQTFIHWSIVTKEMPEFMKPVLQYRELEIPPLVDMLLVEASAFLSPTHLILHLEDVEEDSFLLEKLNKFKEISAAILEEGPKQPVLQKPFLYKPCCVPFPVDNLWYRGFVLDELPDGETLMVQYVDYGNVETLPISSVHELKEEWAELEVLGLLCELNNISLSEDVSVEEGMQLLTNTLSNEGPLKAIVKERSPLRVDLYSGDSSIHEKLVDFGVFKQIMS